MKKYRTAVAAVSFLLPATVSVVSQPTLSLTREAGPSVTNVTVRWDTNAVGFVLQSRTGFGAGTGWTPYTSAASPIGGAGSATISTKLGGAGFFRLGSPGIPRSVGGQSSPGRVDVPILEAPDRIASTSLSVVIQPESATVQLTNFFTFAALVDGFASNAILSFKWEWNKSPYTTNFVSTNLTWRDLNIGTDTNFLTVPSSPNTNLFTIGPVTTNDVAYYRVTVTAVTTNSTNVASSAAAPFWAWQPTNSIIVWGNPVYAINGSYTPCPGSYSNVVYFSSGYYPDSVNNHFFTDLSNSSSIIAWSAWKGPYSGWGMPGTPCSSLIALIPSQYINYTFPYYFTVYIPSTAQPANPDFVHMDFH
jgi:hypothetical protein